MQGDLFSEESTAQTAPARPSIGRLPGDHAQRQRAVSEFGVPIMLEAGAGTGKTATLVARVVAWCVGPGWEASVQNGAKETPEDQAVELLGSIAAITFTEAAAAEMATRVAEGLRALGAACRGHELDTEQLPTGLAAEHLPDDLTRLRERSEALAGALEYLNFSTIHSFCRRLLASHPLEVGLPPGFEVDASGDAQRRSVRRAMEAYLAEAWRVPIDADLLVLAREGFGAPEVEETVLDLLKQGAQAKDLSKDPFHEALVDGMLGTLEATSLELAGFLGELFGALPAKQNVHALLATLAEWHSIFTLERQAELRQESASERLGRIHAELHAAWSPQARSKAKALATHSLLKGEEKLLDGAPQEPLWQLVDKFQRALEPFDKLNPILLNSGRRILERVLGAVERDLKQRGMATFNDLIVDAHRLLMEHPKLASLERARMGLLLVDEFQDTDQMQCDMVQVLALQGPKAERPSLFIVGDPKQSIYSFRGADLSAYDRFKVTLRAAGGEVLSLTSNFRSTQEVLEEVTRVIGPVMQAEDGVQPPFVPLEAFRGPGELPGVEHWVSWVDEPDGSGINPVAGRKKVPSYATEARAIAQDIAAQVGHSNATWSDFALILRSMTSVDTYLDALREAGIPFEVQSDRSYYLRREVIDAGALVRAALDPTDILAVVTLLRSPMVGLPDAALLPLWARDFPGQLVELTSPDAERLARLERELGQVAQLLPADLPGIEGIRGWEHSVHSALCSLAEVRQAFGHEGADGGLSIPAWIGLLRAHFLPAATEAARYQGAFRLANLERFFGDLENLFIESNGDRHGVLRNLRGRIERNERIDTQAGQDLESQAVRIMTIHSSKGLEFRCVYLPQLHRDDEAGKRSPGSTAFGRGSGEAEYRLFGANSPGQGAEQSERLRTDRAERVRLFYVAMTRAKDRLVMLSHWGKLGQPEPWDKAKHYSQLLGQRANTGAVLAELESKAAERDPSHASDPHGAQWRISALVGQAGSVAPTASPRSPLPTREHSANKFKQLRQWKLEASLHAKRDFSSQASNKPGRSDQAEDTTLGMTQLSTHSSFESTGLDFARAKRVGTRVHEFLEHFPDVDDREAPAGLDREERSAYQEIIEAMACNGILERLAELAPAVLARELPALLPPGEGEGAPTGFGSATMDLVYRDPADGQLVVVDYKTDRISDDADLLDHAHSYRSQGLTYVSALRDALALDKDPRLEFWFLRSGRVATLAAR